MICLLLITRLSYRQDVCCCSNKIVVVDFATMPLNIDIQRVLCRTFKLSIRHIYTVAAIESGDNKISNINEKVLVKVIDCKFY